MRLAGKVAVVTGAARGIGRATAERLLAEGAKVVVSDIDAQTLEKTAAEIGPAADVFAVRADVSKKSEVVGLVEAAVRHFGTLDIMVNNAGIAPVVEFLDVTEEMLDRVLDVNLKGAFYGTQAAGREMVARGKGGVIINMSSINSGLANPNVAPYAISKGGMNQVTSTAAVAFAPHGIRVVGVGPGTIMTDMVAGAFVQSAGNHAILSRTPLGRYGQPSEIASVVAFLASDDASYITGETMYVDGGRRVLNYVVPVKG
ncbi:dehydrogenase [Variovorax paradoxus]|jgi:NAD(P)-dependent dehydrogenase (short-subunit alcohol dehydrogenase family)|uniref:SDR family NAD(P)-dependent oxidoreductase n=1 Tax=Variovorax TaxID=34072 RepID=UPI0006E509F9|nr:SDR family oxidoreductase [Variovorax sp. CY25R-8]KPU95806.1 dehydrogenase [Variovorax paradoxus]KPV11203.1 dehydrogenase [Variovorax paradoxus]KPV13112.1 dehydrogenase [Variovorax paradoxus]KPV21220.1 dehydrogenase [Variovorax paradoxus]KPV26805.1 dehydrogenase [Variovorax paradoxus]